MSYLYDYCTKQGFTQEEVETELQHSIMMGYRLVVLQREVRGVGNA